jgi:hypothetical protein
MKPAVILCYNLVTSKYDNAKDKETKSHQDFWEIFTEEDEYGNTEMEQAVKRLGELEQMYDDSESATEIYTWNIALVAQTSEHYNILQTN